VRDEVKKVFAYWMSKEGTKSQKEPRSIKSVVVTGHVAEMTDVAEYLGKHIGVPAVLGNVWQNAFSLDTHIPDITFEESLPLAVAIGVALPG
jgi:Tfp pilus assembly PilM family ATPase